MFKKNILFTHIPWRAETDVNQKAIKDFVDDGVTSQSRSPLKVLHQTNIPSKFPPEINIQPLKRRSRPSNSAATCGVPQRKQLQERQESVVRRSGDSSRFIVLPSRFFWNDSFTKIIWLVNEMWNVNHLHSEHQPFDTPKMVWIFQWVWVQLYSLGLSWLPRRPGHSV